MKFVTEKKFMFNELGKMLCNGEKFYFPVYGMIRRKKSVSVADFGFFALTDNHLLVAVLNPFDGNKIDNYYKIPLDIKYVKIRKTPILKFSVLKIYFNSGESCKIQMSKKLLIGDFTDQEKNVENFLKFFLKYAN
mgnify:FL=1